MYGVVLEILHAEGICVYLAVGFEQVIGISRRQRFIRILVKAVVKRLAVEEFIVFGDWESGFLSDFAEIRRSAHVPNLFYGNALIEELCKADY